MSCCVATIQSFSLAERTTINYSESMQLRYGSRPNVQVYYVDPSGELVISDDMNQVVFDGTTIEVDHGGINSGVIKIF